MRVKRCLGTRKENNKKKSEGKERVKRGNAKCDKVLFRVTNTHTHTHFSIGYECHAPVGDINFASFLSSHVRHINEVKRVDEW